MSGMGRGARLIGEELLPHWLIVTQSRLLRRIFYGEKVMSDFRMF